jgi:gliding motility-associated-like protein
MGVNPLPQENTLLINNPDQYIKCYRILAYEDGGEATVSWSNDVCFTFDPNVYVPNAFTPNNDNLNDGFGVVGIAVNEYRIQIYNRWGEKIYESEDIDAKWDATYLGKDVQVGTYLYLINFTDFDGKIYQRTGTINLIR